MRRLAHRSKLRVEIFGTAQAEELAVVNRPAWVEADLLGREGGAATASRGQQEAVRRGEPASENYLGCVTQLGMHSWFVRLSTGPW